MLTMTRPRICPIGLQLGPRSAMLVQLSGNPGEQEVFQMAQGEMPFDEHASSEVQDREIAAALRKLIADHHFRGHSVVSCLGSQELFVQNVRLPKLPPEEIDKVVRWEAEERLPYPLAEAEIRHLIAAEVRQDANIKQEVILLACHQGIIKRHVALLESAGLVPAAIDVEPCAILRCLQAGEIQGKEHRAAYIHLGERSTTVIFAEGEQILFLKYISSGGHHLDLAVARHLNLPLPEAAKMRAVVSGSQTLDNNDEVHRSIIEAIQAPLEAMSTEVGLCLRYYKVTFRGRPIEKFIIIGEEASPWMAEFLSSRVGGHCEIGDPFGCLGPGSRAREIDRPGRWATAVGLSLKETVLK